MKIKISKLALSDIDSIWLYTKEQWSMEQASRYYDLIFDEFDRLAKFPDSGKEAESVGPGNRYSQIKSHLIFYRINRETNVLEIIRVLHERMNSTQWLNK